MKDRNCVSMMLCALGVFFCFLPPISSGATELQLEFLAAPYVHWYATPGHAFVKIYSVTGTQRELKETLGFVPSKNIYKIQMIIDTKPGQFLHDDPHVGDLYLRVMIDEKQLRRIESELPKEFDTTNYSVISYNCVKLAARIAEIAGLKVPPVYHHGAIPVIPETWSRQLVDENFSNYFPGDEADRSVFILEDFEKALSESSQKRHDDSMQQERNAWPERVKQRLREYNQRFQQVEAQRKAVSTAAAQISKRISDFTAQANNLAVNQARTNLSRSIGGQPPGSADGVGATPSVNGGGAGGTSGAPATSPQMKFEYDYRNIFTSFEDQSLLPPRLARVDLLMQPLGVQASIGYRRFPRDITPHIHPVSTNAITDSTGNKDASQQLAERLKRRIDEKALAVFLVDDAGNVDPKSPAGEFNLVELGYIGDSVRKDVPTYRFTLRLLNYGYEPISLKVGTAGPLFPVLLPDRPSDKEFIVPARKSVFVEVFVIYTGSNDFTALWLSDPHGDMFASFFFDYTMIPSLVHDDGPSVTLQSGLGKASSPAYRLCSNSPPFGYRYLHTPAPRLRSQSDERGCKSYADCGGPVFVADAACYDISIQGIEAEFPRGNASLNVKASVPADYVVATSSPKLIVMAP